MHMTEQDQPATPQPIRIVEIDIPFKSLLGFFVKATFAAIPAALIVGALIAIGAGLLMGLVKLALF